MEKPLICIASLPVLANSIAFTATCSARRRSGVSRRKLEGHGQQADACSIPAATSRICMGDPGDREARFVQPDQPLNDAKELLLRQAGTDITRLSTRGDERRPASPARLHPRPAGRMPDL